MPVKVLLSDFLFRLLVYQFKSAENVKINENQNYQYCKPISILHMQKCLQNLLVASVKTNLLWS